MQTYRTYRNEQTPTLPVDQLWRLLKKYWFQLLLILFGLHLFFTREVRIQVDIQSPANLSSRRMEVEAPHARTTALGSIAPSRSRAGNEHRFSMGVLDVVKNPEKEQATGVTTGSAWRSDQFSNLSFVLNPGLAEQKGVPEAIVEEKLEKCRQYVERFAKVAIVERDKFGIPVSIKLAQGLLETNAGESKLVQESSNHFGIKCKPQCGGCTCRNYADDDRYDMFRVFDSAWESYREHSVLLQSDRYRHLMKLDRGDYEGWARGLKKAGYATDPQYAEKLIRIIEALDLFLFDQLA